MYTELPYFPGRMVTGSVRNISDIREAACGGNSFSARVKQHNLLRNIKSLISKGTQGDAKFELGHLAETTFSFVFMQPWFALRDLSFNVTLMRLCLKGLCYAFY